MTHTLHCVDTFSVYFELGVSILNQQGDKPFKCGCVWDVVLDQEIQGLDKILDQFTVIFLFFLTGHYNRSTTSPCSFVD